MPIANTNLYKLTWMTGRLLFSGFIDML